jgi:hypothetical protein
LSCRLARSIDIKNNVTATLPVEDATNGFRGPSFWEAELLEKRPKGF